MKILILCTSPDLGGLELYAEQTARFLERREHECHLALLDEGKLASRCEPGEFPTLHLGAHSHMLPLRSAVRLARYLARERIELIHMHWGKDLNLAALALVLLRLARWGRRGPRLLYTRHMGIQRSKKDPYHRFAFRQVDRFLAVSELVLRGARKHLPLAADKIDLLYPGVALEGASARESADSPAPPSAPLRVGMVGRIQEGKGQHLLVEALHALAEQGIDAHATFVGHSMGDDYMQELERSTAALGLTERVSFLGFVENPTRMMPEFDVVVLLTDCETFGLVLVEAMRCGVAVIGTDAGGVPEIIQHESTGLLVPPRDSAALTRELARLHRDADLRQRLAQAGKERADRMFDRETQYAKLESAMSDLVAAR